ncbi:hypothetical protein [Micromonospora sp. IBHARD004]|uniref:hypothetical protein n=1 Tax=Micromonospora sp. IBHARD004 TaxID=3457764 RepID=UPI004058560C
MNELCGCRSPTAPGGRAIARVRSGGRGVDNPARGGHGRDRTLFDRISDRGMLPMLGWEPWDYKVDQAACKEKLPAHRELPGRGKGLAQAIAAPHYHLTWSPGMLPRTKLDDQASRALSS